MTDMICMKCQNDQTTTEMEIADERDLVKYQLKMDFDLNAL